MNRQVVAWGCFLGAVSVGLGAFGSHGLREHLDDRGLELYRTAIQYLMLHSVGTVLAGIVLSRRAGIPAALFSVGSLLFCGSLIGLALEGPRVLGAVAPLGGSCFIAGWLVFGWYALRDGS